MAKKKKKKICPKQQEAEHRKAFLRKINDLALRLGVEDFTAGMSPALQRNMFDLRMRGVTVVSESPAITPTVMKEIKEYQGQLFRRLEVELTEGGTSVTILEMLTIAQSLYYFLKTEDEVKDNAELQTVFADFLHWLGTEKEPYGRLDDVLWFATTNWCELTHRLYWLTHSFRVEDYRIYNEFKLDTVQAEQRRLRLEGHTRAVYRVGWALPDYGPHWASVKASLFGNSSTAGEEELPVFVQSHALRRLEERLDCTERHSQQYHLYLSLQEPHVVKGPNGKWLIRYRFKELHLGYLVADVVDGILVLRTFLFITMDSTPEGRALQEALGLAAVDKKYLAIDRLSTFLISDIAEHPDLKEHFLKAGCDDLFVFDTTAVLPEHRLELGDRIRNYLDTGLEQQMLASEVPSEEPQEAMV